MFDLSKNKINIDCPKCGRTNAVVLKKVAAQQTITCIGCSTGIALKDKNGSTGKSIQSANKAVKDLENILKKFGR